MSFSGEMKEEIARLIPMQEADVRAELSAIIRFCGRIIRLEDSVAVLVETENVALAKTFVKLIKKAFDIQVQLEIRRHGAGKNNQYFIVVGATGGYALFGGTSGAAETPAGAAGYLYLECTGRTAGLAADVRKQACLYQRGISLCRFYE